MKTTTVLMLTAWLVNMANCCQAHHPMAMGQSGYPMHAWFPPGGGQWYPQGHPYMMPGQNYVMPGRPNVMQGHAYVPPGHAYVPPVHSHVVPGQHTGTPNNSTRHFEDVRRGPLGGTAGAHGRGELRRKTLNERQAPRPHLAVKARPAQEIVKKPAVAVLGRDGKVAWPEALLTEHFTPQRQQLEMLLGRRTAGGSLNSGQRKALRFARQSTLDELKRHIHEISSRDYFAALRFVRSLSDALAAPELPAQLAGR